MNDYKDLIQRMKHVDSPLAREAASAIETLVKERDAAIANLQQLSEEEMRCDWCAHNGEIKCDIFVSCADCGDVENCVCAKCFEERKWKWRGVSA